MSLSSFFNSQLKDFTYFYLIRIILFAINHLFAQFNVYKYCYVLLTIKLNVSHLFTHTWMLKQFYFKQFRVYLGAMAMKRYSVFPQSFCITGASPSAYLVSYLGHTLPESYPSAQMQSVCSAASPGILTGQNQIEYLEESWEPEKTVFVSPPNRQDLTQGHFIVGVWRRGGFLREDADHRITKCSGNFVSLCQVSGM